MFQSSLVAVVLSITCMMPLACLWDYDTLEMERAGVPDVHEAIVGYFPRHSEHYYRWRIKNRMLIPVEQRSPGDYDDISVAHEKLGDHAKAIRTIEEKIARWPKRGRYESEANLATFLIHSGDWQAGLAHIDKALKINPDAHFGRELYQKKLVEYLMQLQGDQDLETSVPRSNRFDEFLYLTKDPDAQLSQRIAEGKAAVKGLVGMIRFGNHDSPVLLAALGDLLSSQLMPNVQEAVNANRLAARAYLVASYASEEPIRSQYRASAQSALSMQVGESIGHTESWLRHEIAQSEALEDRIKADEKEWADQGENLDKLFALKYQELPTLKVPRRSTGRTFFKSLLAVAALSVTAALAIAWKRKRTPGLGKNSVNA